MGFFAHYVWCLLAYQLMHGTAGIPSQTSIVNRWGGLMEFGLLPFLRSCDHVSTDLAK